MTRTAKNAYRYGLTVYDSSYLVCVEIAEANLVTADEKLFDKAKENKRITLLSEYEKATTNRARAVHDLPERARDTSRWMGYTMKFINWYTGKFIPVV